MPPLIARRLAAGVAVVGFLAIAAWLLLVDSSIGYLSIIGDLQDIVGRIGRRFEARSGLDLLDRSDVPGEKDDYGHALLWGTGMIVVGWILRHRVSIALSALLVAGTSLVFEILQPVVSDGRATQATDVVANVLGIVIAACFLGIVLLFLRRFDAPEPDVVRVRHDGSAAATPR